MFIRVTFTLAVLMFLTGCFTTTTAELLQNQSIRKGISKNHLGAAMMYAPLENRPMVAWSNRFQEWNQSREYEILAGSSRETFFLFEFVTQPFNPTVYGDWDYGTGVLHSWHSSYEDALNAARSLRTVEEESQRIAEEERRIAQERRERLAEERRIAQEQAAAVAARVERERIERERLYEERRIAQERAAAEEARLERERIEEENRIARERAIAAEEERRRTRQVSSGTSFAVTQQGDLITNFHVVEGCNELKVHYGGNEIEAKVLSSDEVNDLALLRAEFSPGGVLPLSDENVAILDEVYVAGYPFGEAVSSSIKITGGRVNALSGVRNNFSQIQFDAVIQPGNSGGPVLNSMGNVVAVAVATLDQEVALEQFGVIPQNSNFGIKSSVVRNLLSSNGISLIDPNSEELDTRTLGVAATSATFYLSCWMTEGRIQEMRSSKTMFSTRQQ